MHLAPRHLLKCLSLVGFVPATLAATIVLPVTAKDIHNAAHMQPDAVIKKMTEDQARQHMILLARAVQKTEQTILDTEKELQRYGSAVEDRCTSIAAKRIQTARFLSQLWHMSQRSRLAWFAQADNLNEQVRATILAERLVPFLQARSHALTNDLGTLNDLLHQSQETLARLKTERAALFAQQQVLADSIAASRSRYPSDLLSNPCAQALRKLWQREHPQTIAELIVHAEPILKKHLKHKHDALRFQRPPAQGHCLAIVPKNRGHHPNGQAIVIKTSSHTRVVSPLSSTVAFAGMLRGYGDTIVLAASPNDFVILSGLSKITVFPGQELISGEPLGTMPNVTNGHPQLYVEHRHGVKASNLTQWVDIWNGEQKDA